MEAAACSRNSKFPAILMILPHKWHLPQKKQHILLTYTKFETFLNHTQKEQEYTQDQKNNCHFDWYHCQKRLHTQQPTTEGSKQMTDKLSLENKK